MSQLTAICAPRTVALLGGIRHCGQGWSRFGRRRQAAWLCVFAAAMALTSVTRAGDAPTLTSDHIASVDVTGTTLSITLASGKKLQKAELVGATLSLVLPGETEPKSIRIDSVVTDPMDPENEVLLYRITVLDEVTGKAEELCEPDPQGNRWAFSLRGTWDLNGQHISDQGFTLTCATGAQGKCVRFGYKPWKILSNGANLADYHQACIRLVRADYCGNKGTTKDGMLIDLYDQIGILEVGDAAEHHDLQFEAAWGTHGALCVAHTRVPENVTLEQLADECPRLRGHIGEAACSRADAEAGRFGPALLFNRSR